MATDRDDARKALVAALEHYERTQPLWGKDGSVFVNAARAYLRATEGDGDAKLRELRVWHLHAVEHFAGLARSAKNRGWSDHVEDPLARGEIHMASVKEIDRLLAAPAPEAGEQPAAPSPGYLVPWCNYYAGEFCNKCGRSHLPAAPSPEPAPPMKNGEGSLCGLCDGTYQHEHQRVRCPKCGAEGLAENWPFRKCEGCAEPRCKARVWDNGDMTDCGLAMPCSTHGKPEPAPLCEEAREWRTRANVILSDVICAEHRAALQGHATLGHMRASVQKVLDEAAAAWSAEKQRAEWAEKAARDSFRTACKVADERDAADCRESAAASEVADLRARLAARERLEALFGEVVQAVAELPGRSSPDDWPEAMLVTGNELLDILRDKLGD